MMKQWWGIAFTVGFASLTKTVSASAPLVSDAIGTGAEIRMLVVGDSVMWGQGLAENHKTSKLVQSWLAGQLGTRVARVVHAHSGAQVRDRSEAGPVFAGEIPSPLPTVGAQMESVDRPVSVDLVLLNGCINDMPSDILLGGPTQLYVRARAAAKCYWPTVRLLEEAIIRFPKAILVFVGYYPLFTESLTGIAGPATLERLRQLWCEHGCPSEIDVPGRSRAFVDASNMGIANAVREMSIAHPQHKMTFVPWPRSAKSGYGSAETHLWSLLDRDEVMVDRIRECAQAYLQTRQWNHATLCDKAAVFHPNPRGAQTVAVAIEAALTPFLSELRARSKPPVRTLNTVVLPRVTQHAKQR